jgi:hypothetical protein
MNKDSTVVRLRQPEEIDDPLTAVLRSGARRLLAQALESEAAAFLALMADWQLEDGQPLAQPSRPACPGCDHPGSRSVKIRRVQPTWSQNSLRTRSHSLTVQLP